MKVSSLREASSCHSRAGGNPAVYGSPIKAFGDDTSCQIASLPSVARNDDLTATNGMRPDEISGRKAMANTL